MTQKISSLNWNTRHYYSDNLIAFISLGAEPAENEIGPQINYYVTLSNTDYEDIYQSVHADLEDAVASLNAKYGDWQLKNLENNQSDSSCSTCAAH
jgi:hypothetical protein